MSDPDFRRFTFGLSTLLGEPRGFFAPYRHAPGVLVDVPVYAEIEAMMQAANSAMRAVLSDVQAAAGALRSFGGDAPEPRFTQDWFPRLDGAAAYALVRSERPRRIVEVGSGHSTRFMARAVREGGFACAITCIDPQPRAALQGLPVRWIEALLGDEHFRLVDTLEAGDVLFIDSSHILWPGTDVDMLFARLLPRLAQGVLVHIHDVFLPDGYPPAWRWRGYSEQQGVAALLAGGGYDIVFSSHFALTRLGAVATTPVLRDLALPEGAFETSLWLRKARAGVWRP